MEDMLYDEAFGPLSVGDVVPEELTFDVFRHEEIEKMSMKELRGSWAVFFFYPGDFTFVCPTELADMQKHYNTFKAENAEVIAVSTDSPYVHKAWHDISPTIKEVAYPMAADTNHELSELFGVLIENEGVARRGTFIVTPEGVIAGAEVVDNSVGRSAAETFRKLKAAKHVAAHPGQVCPANWKEGDETLQPGLDLVGKI